MQRRHDQSTYSTVTKATAEKNTEKLAKAKTELKGLHLTQSQEQQIVEIFSQNSGFITRILGLIKDLIKFEIPLSEMNLKLIASNATKSGYIASLLASLSEKGIVLKYVPFSMVCDAAKHFDQFLLSLSFFTGNKKLDIRTVFLLCTMPEHALDLAKFVTALIDRGYLDANIEKIKNTLRLAPAEQPKSREFMPQFIELMSLVLEKGFFYTEFVSIVLNMGEKANQVLEGAKELNLQLCLSSEYLELVQLNLDNARFFAKNIVLLSNAGFVDINDKESLSRISGCEEGTFYLFQHLSLKDKLDAKTFATVLTHNAVLRDSHVVAAFKALPLLDKLCDNELNEILHSLANRSPSEAVDSIVQFLDGHKLENCNGGQTIRQA